MSLVSLMECNGKPPLQWDWENLIMFNATAADNLKKMPTTVWGIDGERCFDSRSFYSSGGVSQSGGSGSDFPLTPLSKSQNSASISSSSIGDAKSSKPTLDGSDAIQENFPCGKPLFLKIKPASASAPEASAGSGEPLLTLKLGKRAYFEDVGTVSNARSSSFSGIPVSSVGSTKRSKSGSQGTHAPRCQVEGCNLDLSAAKDYHRKHRVCESHSKCAKVIVAGLERRFCQQCSRFHGLSEFDEKKRSCRRRLSDHNARRRKPQPDYVQLNAARMSSSFYDDGQQISSWNAQGRPKANYSWEDRNSSKFTITKEYMLKPAKVGSAQIQLPASHLTNSIHMHGHNTNGLLSSTPKGPALDVVNQDLDESIITLNVDATQDLHRALSLLSTNAWGLSDSKSTPLEQPARTSHNGMPQSLLPMITQSLPVTSSVSLRTEHQQIDAQVQTFTSTPFEFQEFQFPRTPYESDFYSSQLN